MNDKRHCCWCINLFDGVILVGIYGASFHAGLLVVQCIYGPTLTPSYPLDPNSDSVVHPVLVAVHVVGSIVNMMLVAGAYTSHRYLMTPWFIGQGLLALLLSILALYYLVLYPQSNCHGSNFKSDCTLLLWHTVIMVLSLLLLLYYIYVVSEFFSQLKVTQEKNKRTLEQLYIVERQETKGQKGHFDWHQQLIPGDHHSAPEKAFLSTQAFVESSQQHFSSNPLPEEKQVSASGRRTTTPAMDVVTRPSPSAAGPNATEDGFRHLSVLPAAARPLTADANSHLQQQAPGGPFTQPMQQLAHQDLHVVAEPQVHYENAAFVQDSNEQPLAVDNKDDAQIVAMSQSDNAAIS